MTYTVYFSNSGVPATGLTPSWGALISVDTSTPFLPQPTIAEVGSGYYKFDLTPVKNLVGVIDGGVTLPNSDRYKPINVQKGVATAFGSCVASLSITDSISSGPIPDVEVVILNQDESIIVNSALTNSMGALNAQLNPGVYSLHIRKDGYNFTVPTIITVVSDAIFNFVGTNVGDIEADFRTVIVPKDTQY